MGPTVTALRFDGMPAPTLDDAAAMATTTVRSSMVATFSDGRTQTFALGYQPFFLTGTPVPDGQGGTVLAGGCHDIRNAPIIDGSGAAPRQFFSDCPDGMSLLTLPNPKVPGVKGNTVFAVVQFEYTSKNRAGASRYGQAAFADRGADAGPGPDHRRAAPGQVPQRRHQRRERPVDHLRRQPVALGHAPVERGIRARRDPAGDPSSWPNSAPTCTATPRPAKPYHYGHLPEVTVNPDGTGSIKKHYCLGRISHELVQVMPDERTVLMGDDATNGGLFMFIADAARDLGAGTLYVAQWKLTSKSMGGAGTLRWIRLGHASSDSIEALANTLAASDIVDSRTKDPRDPAYTPIAFSGKTQWVKFVPGRETAAAFLETHRYAAFRGGSMVFTKMEGTTVNARDKIAYSAMSGIRAAMQAAAGLDQKIEAGAVYALNLGDGQVDTDGGAIDSAWVPLDMAAIPELTGEDIATDALGNKAAVDKVSQADNLKFSEKLRTLFIGEDTGLHVNNFLWAYNVDTKTLTRILSCPAGAESTGLQACDDINGFSYVMSNFQHAGDDIPKGAGSHAAAAGGRELRRWLQRCGGLPHRHAQVGRALGLIPAPGPRRVRELPFGQRLRLRRGRSRVSADRTARPGTGP